MTGALAVPEGCARRLRVAGHVQGVGFRPFVYRLAQLHGLTGWVRNQYGEVSIVVQGPPAGVSSFERDLTCAAPPLAKPAIIETIAAPLDAALRAFSILESEAGAQPRVFVPPDYFTCADCLRELRDPRDRRYRYPFINCTQCGPRYTLIERLPYDRPNTTMAGFPLCADCEREYRNPTDRRFHAEPIACPRCGPSLTLVAGEREAQQHDEAALRGAVERLRAGQILAVRGVGGYHLMCDARNESAVASLRRRKHRPHKPLAVMFPVGEPDPLEAIRQEADLDDVDRAALLDPARPIVLVRRRAPGTLAPSVAPGLEEVGAFLPYSPLHHLLLGDFGAPLVATSGNISGEPVLTDSACAQERLAPIADAFLHHDRPIARPADDPVLRRRAGRHRPMRLGRGTAPLELKAPFALQVPTLAVGGHLHVTVALAWEDRVVVSPHIGTLDSSRSLEVFAQVVRELQDLYAVEARAVVCDAHPRYATHRWARASGLPVRTVLHHHAHASAVAGELDPTCRWLVFTWDGLGLGADDTLWGGETFLGKPGEWHRVASVRELRLLGGDRVAYEPWRSAAAMAWELGASLECLPEGAALALAAWKSGQNCVRSSSVGRMFDAAAALVLGLTRASYDGQGPAELEAASAGNVARGASLPLVREAGGLLRADWQPLLASLADASVPPALRAGAFHDSLARTALEITQRVAAREAFARVGLSGGVFQNRLLTDRTVELLRGAGFEALVGEAVPCGDGGLSYGQIVEAAARSARSADGS